VWGTDTSDNAFTITPVSVTLTAPNGGQSLVGGQAYNVTWNHSGTIAAYRVMYTQDGTNYTTVATSTAATSSAGPSRTSRPRRPRSGSRP